MTERRKNKKKGRSDHSLRGRLLGWLALTAAAVASVLCNERLASDAGLLFCLLLGTGAVLCLLWFFAGRAYRRVLRLDREKSMRRIDAMDGMSFETFCAGLLQNMGYSRIHTTRATADQGADLLAEKDALHFCIQCKRYDAHVGNKAVQEAFAGKTHYGCDAAIVITNSYFTRGAAELAATTGVLLWDRTFLLGHARYFPI